MEMSLMNVLTILSDIDHCYPWTKQTRGI